MIYCCTLRLSSHIRVTHRRCWFPDSVVLSCCAWARCLGPAGRLHTYEMVTEHLANPKFDCGCCEMLFFRICGVRQNIYVFSLYSNPDLNDRIFYCLLASMAAVQADDVRASFLFLGDLNGHHQDWSSSTTTNHHGVQPLTLQLSPVGTSWLSAQPTRLVEHLTS